MMLRENQSKPKSKAHKHHGEHLPTFPKKVAIPDNISKNNLIQEEYIPEEKFRIKVTNENSSENNSKKEREQNPLNICPTKQESSPIKIPKESEEENQKEPFIKS